MFEITYKENLFTGKPYPSMTVENYVDFLKSNKDSLFSGDLGIYFSRRVSYKGEEFYFPFIDIDGNGSSEDEKITSAIQSLYLTMQALKQIGVLDRFFVIATGGTGFRVFSNLLLSEVYYRSFISFVKRDLPHIIDTQPTEEMDMPHQLFAYKKNSKTPLDRHSCLLPIDTIDLNDLTPTLYKQLTEGPPDPTDWIYSMHWLLDFEVILDVDSLGDFGKRLDQYKKIVETTKIKTFDFNRMIKKVPPLSLEALETILNERGYACEIRDRGGKLAISFQGFPCPCCGKTTSNARIYSPNFILSCFNVNCKAHVGIPLSDWLIGDWSLYTENLNQTVIHPEIHPTIPLQDFPTWIEPHLALNEDILIGTTPGSGKTHDTIKWLLPQAASKVILYSCLNKRLQEEAFNMAKSLNPSVKIHRIHARNDVCLKKEELKQITDAGYSPSDLLCRSCEHRSSCEYYTERETVEPGMYFVTHHMLQYLKNRIENPDRVVLDENILKGFLIVDSISQNDLNSLADILNDQEMKLIKETISMALELAMEAVRCKRHSFIFNARKITGEETEEDYLIGILSRENECDEMVIQKQIEGIIEKIKTFSSYELHKKECNYKAVKWLEGLVSKESLSYLTVSNQGNVSYCVKHLVQYPYPHVPIKVLDATADKKVIESVIQKKIQPIFANIEWNATLTHIKQAINRKRLCSNKEKDLKKIVGYSLNRINGNKVLIVSYKPIMEKLVSVFKKEAVKMGKSIEFKSFYFHGSRGINTYQDCDSVIVVGLPYQNMNSTWHDAHILFPDDEDEEYRNSWIEQCMMEELIQVIHRIRPVRKEQTEIVIVSKFWPSNLPEPNFIDDRSHDEFRVKKALERLKPIVKELGFLNQDVGFLGGVYVKKKENSFKKFTQSIVHCYEAIKSEVRGEGDFESDSSLNGNWDYNQMIQRVIFRIYNNNQKITLGEKTNDYPVIHNDSFSNDPIILPNTNKWCELITLLKNEFPSFTEFSIKLPHTRNQSIKGIGQKDRVIQFYSEISKLGIIKDINPATFQILCPSNFQPTILPKGMIIFLFPEDDQSYCLMGYRDQVEWFNPDDPHSIIIHPEFQGIDTNTQVITNKGIQFAKIFLQHGRDKCKVFDVRVNEKIIHCGISKENRRLSEILSFNGIQYSHDGYVQISQIHKLYKIQQQSITDHALQNIVQLETEMIWVIAGIELAGIGIDVNKLNELTSQIQNNRLEDSTGALGKNIKTIKRRLQNDDRYHDQIDPVTATGRLSCSLHSMSRKDEIRSLFVPRSGYRFIIADYRAFEARIACGLSEDENGVHLFQENKDIYLVLAEEYVVWKRFGNRTYLSMNQTEELAHLSKIDLLKSIGVLVEDIQPYRDMFKQVVLTLNNGGTEYAVAKQLEVPINEAINIIAIYDRKFPLLNDWKERVLSHAFENNSIQTKCGRLRTIPEIDKPSSIINFMIQGNASDGFKQALILLKQRIDHLPAKIVHTMHDEIIVEVRDDCIDTVKDIIEKSMKEPFEGLFPGLPFELDIHVSDSWGY